MRALPEADVRLETEKGGTGVKVSAEQFESRMPTLPREDFPSLPESGGAAKSTIKGSVLREMVAKTQFAITGEDTRYYLNGALFVLRARLDDAGRDRWPSSRAGQRAARSGGQGGDEIKAILPRKTLSELSRLLERRQSTCSTSAARTICSSRSGRAC